MLNRNFRGTVEKIKPQVKKGREEKKYCKTEESRYAVEDAVYVKNYGQGKPWLEGKIIEVLGVRNYKVQLKNFGNLVWRRHSDQLIPRFTPPSSEGMGNENQGYMGDLSPSVQTIPVKASVDVESHIAPNNSAIELSSNEECTEPHGLSQVPLAQPEPAPLRRSGRTVKPPDRLNL